MTGAREPWQRKTAQTVDVLHLDYRLVELPSSQHRAGLAGLVLMLNWLKQQGKIRECAN